MRQFSDSSAAPEMVRKPLPSANYHLVRFIWQLGTIDCPASFCMTGRQRNHQIFGNTVVYIYTKKVEENEINTYGSFWFPFREQQACRHGGFYTSGLIFQCHVCPINVTWIKPAFLLKHPSLKLERCGLFLVLDQIFRSCGHCLSWELYFNWLEKGVCVKSISAAKLKWLIVDGGTLWDEKC